jgi:hypothetical protein
MSLTLIYKVYLLYNLGVGINEPVAKDDAKNLSKIFIDHREKNEKI